jgi:hypothetical protein
MSRLRGVSDSDEIDVITMNRHVFFNRIIQFHALSNVRRRIDADADINGITDALDSDD